MPNVPRKYVVEAACQEVKVEIEPGDRTVEQSLAMHNIAAVGVEYKESTPESEVKPCP